MSNIRKHLFNTMALVSSGALSKAFVFIANVQILKKLETVDNGPFQLALSLAFVYSIITEVGLRGYAVREIARVREDRPAAERLFSHIMLTRLVFGILGIPLMLLFLWLAGYTQRTTTLTLLLIGYTMLDSLDLVLKYALRGFERMHFEAVVAVFGRGLFLAWIIYLAATDRMTLWAIAAAYIGSSAIELSTLIIASKTAFRLTYRHFPSLSTMRHLAIMSFPFAVINLVGILYIRTGTLLLSKMLNEEAVAYFNTAAKVPEALTFVPIAIINALIPFLSRQSGDMAVVQRYSSFLFRYVGFLAVGTAVYLWMEAEFVVLLISRKEYLNELWTFRLYGGWTCVVFLHYAFANLLICLNDEKYVMRRYIAALAVNLVLNLVLIQRYGIVGAAVSLFATESLALMFDAWRLVTRGIHLGWSAILQVFGFACATAVTLHVLAPLSPWVRTGVAILICSSLVGAVLLTRDRHLIRGLRRSPV